MKSALPQQTDITQREGEVRKVPQPDSSARQVRTFRDLFLITELLDSKAESDDVGFEAELARMSCQIERAFRFVEVLKKAAAGGLFHFRRAAPWCPQTWQAQCPSP